ncbi:hypothetical protein IRJ41_006164 [Triplophysa rosa]|uniref:Uncharacterized protein n=1 Tax=Triplophysa rosa TaxID=992332 RepID=A0A9W7TVK9_TRIRA|nr:hypothetical protein IRJ41_006164 [Triplophysa rosa]
MEQESRAFPQYRARARAIHSPGSCKGQRVNSIITDEGLLNAKYRCQLRLRKEIMAFQHKQGSKECQVTQCSFPQYSANKVVCRPVSEARALI